MHFTIYSIIFLHLFIFSCVQFTSKLLVTARKEHIIHVSIFFSVQVIFIQEGEDFFLRETNS